VRFSILLAALGLLAQFDFAAAQPIAPPSIVFTSSAREVAAGRTARLSWTSTGATRCVGSWAQVYEGEAAARGSFTTAVLNSRTNDFSLTCTGPGGTSVQRLTINALPTPRVTLRASTDRALPGASVELSWRSEDASSCTASGNPFAGTKPVSGVERLSGLSKGVKAFKLTCRGVGGAATADTTVTVVAAPTLTFSAIKTQVPEKTGTQLKWRATDATSCRASGAWSGAQDNAGTFATGNIESDRAYTLTCVGLTGTVTETVTVEVVGAPKVELKASEDVVAPGGSLVLNWVVEDAQSCTASGAPFTGSKTIQGGREVLSNLTKGTKTFKLTCKGGGGTATGEAKVTVIARPTLSFAAAKAQIPEKTGTQLKWKATDSTSCIATGDWSGVRGVSGVFDTGALTSDKTYTLRCTGANGHIEAATKVDVLAAPKVTLLLSESVVSTGSSVKVKWSSEFATECAGGGSPFTGSKALAGEEVLSKLTAGERVIKLTCRGGGGLAVVERRLSVTSKPSIATFAMDKQVIPLGSVAVLSWSAINSTRCEASGDWAGVRDVRGQISYAPKASGRYQFSIECGDAGGTVKKTITVAVPHVPMATSYQNKNAVPFDQTQIPLLNRLNIQKEDGEWDLSGQSITIGDFFQEGRFAAFVSTVRSAGLYDIKGVVDSPGKAYFLAQDDAGKWFDRTAELLATPADRETCVTIHQALTADFNNDNRPDIFLACAGRAQWNPLPTGESEVTHPDYAKIHLAKPVLYLSSGERGYTRVELPDRWDVNHASAADLNRDGNIDIVIVYNMQFPKEEDRTPFVLLGNGDGTFKRTAGLLPLINTSGRPTAWDIGGVMAMHLIPIGNRLDLLMVGYQRTAWFRGVSGDRGRFDPRSRRMIELPLASRRGHQYGWPPDVLYAHDSFYFLAPACFDGGCAWDLVRTDVVNFTPVIVPVITNLYNNYQTVSTQVKLASDGSIIAYHGGCPTVNAGMCEMRVKADTGQTLADLETLRFIASYPSLIESIGDDVDKGRAHYESLTSRESKKITFDPLVYVASNPDLIELLGIDAVKAARHYITVGYKAGRPTTGFDPLRYIATHGDLIEGFGLDTAAATRNYILFGYAEGRKTKFEALAYIASFADLIKGLGADALAATEHYILKGFDEGRRALFDALSYVASYVDLMTKFGVDALAAAKHYIEKGFDEGRRVIFSAVAYLANNADVRAKFGTDSVAATKEYISSALKGVPAALDRDPDSPTTRYEAQKFLVRSTFGPTEKDIAELLEFGYGQNGYERWIDAQVDKPISSILPGLIARTPDDPMNMGGSQVIPDRIDLWFRNAILGEDQLRQRVAWALSQIMVVSDNGALLELPWAVAGYQDMLSRNAFGNFRALLEDVTLHPAMGIYLSMYGNQRAVEGTNLRPDENYAREMMQLFSIGLVELNIDGTVKRDATGQPIPTYNQDTIRGFARVFTGWKAQCFSYVPREQCFQRAYLVPWPKEAGFNQDQRMVIHESFHEQGAKQLLVYPGVVLPGGVLPASQGGMKDLEMALDNVFHHPNVAPFISRQLIQKLVTSNPSPEYTRRVAEVFNNDGSGVRGNLKAVIKAILLDKEAQDPTNSLTAGKVKEPLLRVTQLWRMYAKNLPDDKRFIFKAFGSPSFVLGQSPGQSPSVFNFFSPFYAPPGEIADAGLKAPELQLANENLQTQLSNFLFRQTQYMTSRPPSWMQSQSGNVVIDIEKEMQVADDVDALLDLVATRLLGSPEALSPVLREEARNQLRRWKIEPTFTDNRYSTRSEYLNNVRYSRVTDAIFLTVISPEYAVQR